MKGIFERRFGGGGEGGGGEMDSVHANLKTKN